MPTCRTVLRRIAAAAVTACALATATADPAAARAAVAAPAASHITIRARSPHYPGERHGLVDGYALVIYRSGRKRQREATIRGAVATTVRNDRATLLARPFGSRSYSAVRKPVRLRPSRGSAHFSFTVTPSVATRYKVRVTRSGTTAATSHPVTVYVTAGGRDVAHTSCGTTACTYRLRVYMYVPTSAYRTESRKHVYLYLAVGYPALPRDYTLSPTATQTKARKTGAGVYERTLTWHIRLRNGGARWRTAGCTKDTEKRDGLGLPGRHGCGRRHVSRKAVYLG